MAREQHGSWTYSKQTRWGVPLGDGSKNSRLDQLLRLEPLSKDPASLRLFFQNANMRWGPRATVPSSVRLLHFPCILLPCPHCEPTSSPFCEKQLLSKELQAVSCFWKRSYVTDRGVVWSSSHGERATHASLMCPGIKRENSPSFRVFIASSSSFSLHSHK